MLEYDGWNVAIPAALNQRGRPVVFMSRTLQGSELHSPALKNAMAKIESTRKWSPFLNCLSRFD